LEIFTEEMKKACNW